MSNKTKHLPDYKQRELVDLVHIIQEKTKVEMIILFGSHARGDWVEDRYIGEDGTEYHYSSDFDILVIVKTKEKAERLGLWKRVKQPLYDRLRTNVSLIVYDISAFNKRLAARRYFYTDIYKEGIVLYDSKRFYLVEPKELTPMERREKAEEYYDEWYTRGCEFYDTTFYDISKDRLNKAAFELHQSVERFCMAILLVYTDYKPKLHRLDELEKQIIAQDHEFISIFPRTTPEETRLFQLLVNAYIDARYNSKYVITLEELDWLTKRVKKLQQLTEISCQKELKRLAKEEEKYIEKLGPQGLEKLKELQLDFTSHRFPMRTTIDHLPEEKQKEIKELIDGINKITKVEMIILYNSHAYNESLDNNDTADINTLFNYGIDSDTAKLTAADQQLKKQLENFSLGGIVADSRIPDDKKLYAHCYDYDFLVITDTCKRAQNHQIWDEGERFLEKKTKAKINLLAIDVKSLNDKLSEGQFFYTDIYNRGILIYDSEHYYLEEPKELTATERKTLAEDNFKQQFQSGIDFFNLFQFAFSKDKFNMSAFQLHQAYEHVYITILLVLCDYYPEIHNLERLRKLVIKREPIFFVIFSDLEEEENERFELLNKAYFESQYNKEYTISKNDLEWLAEKFEKLLLLTEKVCQQHIQILSSLNGY